MPDLFFYRDPEEAEKEEAARAEEVMASKQADFVAPPAKEEWGGEELASGAAPVTDWSADAAPGAAAHCCSCCRGWWPCQHLGRLQPVELGFTKVERISNTW